MFGRKHTEAVSLVDEVKHLESRVNALELKSAELQLTVLKTVEKVLYQLRARTAMREKAAQEAESEEIVDEPMSYGPPRRVESTEHLARRFKGA